MRTRQWLFVTLPVCVLSGWAAARGVSQLKLRNADAVVATFPAKAVQDVELPAAGTYWVFGAASREAMKQAARWEVTVTGEEGGSPPIVTRPDSSRARDRENRAALDLLFTVRVAQPGRYQLRLASESAGPGDVSLRITRFTPANASAAMRAFGLAALFSALLVVSAVLWFRESR